MARRFFSTLAQGIAFTTIVTMFVASGEMAGQASPRSLAQTEGRSTITTTSSDKLIPVPRLPVAGPVTAMCIGAHAKQICGTGDGPETIPLKGTPIRSKNTIILTPNAPLRRSLIMENQTIFSGGALEQDVVGRRLNLFPAP